MSKTIYLVRHGESEHNAGEIWKEGDALLTERGRAQARLVGERCAQLDIDCIVASNLIRAKDTASIINERVGKPIEYNDSFSERRHHSDFVGKRKDDPEVRRMERYLFDKLHIPGFRHSDEENADDLVARTKEALKYLERHDKDNILVVTHSMFSRALAACVIFGDAVTGHEIARCMRVFAFANTGISILRFDPNDKLNEWRLIVWNDHAHLGQVVKSSSY